MRLALFVCLLTFVAAAQIPTVTPGGVVDAAASGHSTTITPGSLVSIFGSNLASALSVSDSPNLSTTLGDVDSVMINGLRAPLRFVSGAQINAQAPWNLVPGAATVVVTRAGVPSMPVAAQVTQFFPALYGFNLGTAQAIAVNVDGTVTAAAGAIAGVTSHPAGAGDTILLYASGLGPLDQPPPADGMNSVDKLRNTSNPLTATIGGAAAKVDFSGLSPQFTGVYQVNVVIPAGVPAGDATPVLISMGGVRSPDALTIALR